MTDKFEQYSAIAGVYDELNVDVDYGAWARMLDSLIVKHMGKRPSLVLDLACGTGNVTRPLASLGYDMTGVDISAEMLSVAMENTPKDMGVLYLCQDMCDFELYGTVGATVCCLDSVNYLTEDGELESCFACVHNYLDPDGIFIFDVNSPKKFETVYADNSYILEGEREIDGKMRGIYCGWQNCYDAESRLCDFWLTVFTEGEDGAYFREDEHQTERCYTEAELSSALEGAGFEVLEILYDLDNFGIEEGEGLRIFFVARCKKQRIQGA